MSVLPIGDSNAGVGRARERSRRRRGPCSVSTWMELYEARQFADAMPHLDSAETAFRNAGNRKLAREALRLHSICVRGLGGKPTETAMTQELVDLVYLTTGKDLQVDELLKARQVQAKASEASVNPPAGVKTLSGWLKRLFRKKPH